MLVTSNNGMATTSTTHAAAASHNNSSNTIMVTPAAVKQQLPGQVAAAPTPQTMLQFEMPWVLTTMAYSPDINVVHQSLNKMFNFGSATYFNDNGHVSRAPLNDGFCLANEPEI